MRSDCKHKVGLPPNASREADRNEPLIPNDKCRNFLHSNWEDGVVMDFMKPKPWKG